MYAVAHRNTDRAVKAILAQRERDRREADERREAEARRERIERAQHLAEMRAQSFKRAEALIRELAMEEPRFRHTYKLIEKRACRLFKLPITALHSKRRNRDLAFVRHFIMYWTIRLTNLSYPQVGRLMGGRDHTTILHGTKIYPEKRAYMGRKLPKAR